MGIPHLTTTLEPYATHGRLDVAPVIIDGPAFAYHVLFICNRHGLVQPSYKQLGETALAWLDELARCCVRVEAIYFDGSLPLAKRPVRMQRMAKSFQQLTQVYSADPAGRSRRYLAPTCTTSPLVLFSSERPPGKPFPPPSFHVPAVIETLRSHPKYSSLVHLVPGEADAFCAQHVRESGGLVLSSDSDLLAHDLGRGRVGFLRDVYLDGTETLMSSTYCPATIAERLHLAPSDGLRRFAYARKCSPNATLPQLLLDCSSPLRDPAGYEMFCQEYLHHEVAPLPLSQSGSEVSIRSMDPRISELLLQLGCHDNESDDKIYLPILVENPNRGSAWEQSTPIRQLAYTLARCVVPGSSSAIHEYRRVNSCQQKGRQVQLISVDKARTFGNHLVALMRKVNEIASSDSQLTWYLFCLCLDAGYCYELSKQSHVINTLKGFSRMSHSKISWDVIHFAAQLQASYYSLRILKQIMFLAPPEATMPHLYDLMHALPDLSGHPTIDSTVELLARTGEQEVLECIAKLVPSPENLLPQQRTRNAKKTETCNSRRRVAKQNGSEQKSHKSQNPFDVLVNT